MLSSRKSLLSVLISLTLVGCFDSDSNDPIVQNPSSHPVAPQLAHIPVAPFYETEWESIQLDDDVIDETRAGDIEAQIQIILAQMTLEEKVGQMIQPDLRGVTPEDAFNYKLGSILNGGGAFPASDEHPDGNKYATVQDWAAEADKFWQALENAYQDRGFRVPFMWGTDAVHGHNNVFGATLFPHNIGLGAANNPELIRKIGEITAREVAATGLDWTFAPTVATPRDYRWGRTYEGYSEDPDIVYLYAKNMVKGIQGGFKGLQGDTHVISNVKHWVGDGGTFDGVDHGENRYTEQYLRNIHAMGYIGGLEAGAQVVMASFNSWWNAENYDPMGDDNDYLQNQKVHGSQYLITDVLKGKFGFDGIVITDWNGQNEINGCTNSDCAQAVIAGNDIFMVTAEHDWKAFYANVIQQVKDGIISQERIDDAVTRILRVKMRANLWQKPKPSERSLAGKEGILSAPEHVAVARQAVAESLVLLKNENAALPLKKTGQKYLVVGSAAHDIGKQTGGWSLSWQGDGNTLEKDFPNAQTMLMAMQKTVGEENVFTDSNDTNPEEAIAVVVIGEEPYAEMFGDIKNNQTLEFASIKSGYKKDAELVKSLKEQGYKVITVFYSGRPLYVNEEINHSDAFVAAWLPGTEGLGITDVLFGDKDFRGKLSFTWGKTKCSTTINRAAKNITDYALPVDGITGEPIEQELNGEFGQLFPYGYGLNYQGETDVRATEADLNNLPLDPRDFGCGMEAPDNGVADIPLEIFGGKQTGEFVARMSGIVNGWAGQVINKDTTSIGSLTTTGFSYQTQQDAINVKFAGNTGEFAGVSAAQIYMQTQDEKAKDYTSYLNANSTLEFDIRMKSQAPELLNLSTHCEWPCLGEVNIAKVLPPVSNDWTTIKVPLQCFADTGMSFQMLNTPFLLYTEEAVEFDLGNVRYVPQLDGLAEDVLDCEVFQQAALPPLTDAVYDIFTDLEASLNQSDQYSTNSENPIPQGYAHMNASLNAGVIDVSYNTESPEEYKGLLHVNFTKSNFEQFAQGKLQFDINVKSLGKQKPENEATGIVIKVDGDKGSSNDIFPKSLQPENIKLNEWVKVELPMDEIFARVSHVQFPQSINKFTIFAAWGNLQAGVEFELKNIQFIK